MNITIIGGGNIGTLMAAEFASRGHDVTIYTSKPEKWNYEVIAFTENDSIIFSGQLRNVTNKIGVALSEAEVIFLTSPSFLFNELANQMLPYTKPGQMIGIVPGNGGAEFAFAKHILKGCILFGLQRVHSIARLAEYGKSAYMLGRKPDLSVAAVPTSFTHDIAIMLNRLFNMPCFALPNYLSVTLTPSNQILHTSRIYAMFKDYENGVIYPRNFLFYEEWDDLSSEILINCDQELQLICNSLRPLNLQYVKSLKEHYESDTISKMTYKIIHIPAFKGLTSPMKRVNAGWIPDFQSRYFTADFNFGLKIIKDIGILMGINTPHINEVWDWYKSVRENKTEFSLDNYAITDHYSFVSLYD